MAALETRHLNQFQKPHPKPLPPTLGPNVGPRPPVVEPPHPDQTPEDEWYHCLEALGCEKGEEEEQLDPDDEVGSDGDDAVAKTSESIVKHVGPVGKALLTAKFEDGVLSYYEHPYPRFCRALR